MFVSVSFVIEGQNEQVGKRQNEQMDRREGWMNVQNDRGQL